jgi:type II secretory pathway pseudopilin PulG
MAGMKRPPSKTLIVCTIAVLITFIAATVGDRSNSPDARRVARGRVNAIDAACDAYHLAMIKYPSSLDDLFANPGNSAWDGPYLKHHISLVDPWGQAYRYDPNGPRHKGTRPDIWSAGPDKKDATDDDIVNH